MLLTMGEWRLGPRANVDGPPCERGPRADATSDISVDIIVDINVDIKVDSTADINVDFNVDTNAINVDI